MNENIKNRLREIQYGLAPHGYKFVDGQCIPINWKSMNFGKMIDYKKGYAFQSSMYTDNGVRIIRISDTTYNSIKNDSPIYIEKKISDDFTEYRLRKGDIIITTVGSRPPLYDSMVGKVISVPSECEGALLNQNAVRIRAKNEYSQEFITNFFRTKRYLNYIETIVRGNANQVSITLEDLFAYKIQVGPIEEQKEIANILSTWDKAIELKEKLIEEKKNQKTGLMQKLLTGKVRLPGFEGEWKEVSLGDIMKNKTVKTTENDQHQILSCTKDGVVSQSEHFNKQIASTNNIGYKILKKGEVVLSPMNLWLGGIDISNFDIGIVSPAYKVYQVNYSVIGENYLRNLLRSEYMLGLYDSISQKGASTVRRNLSIKDFEALTIKIPNEFEEMNAIDKVLYISAREIELLSSELEYLKEQKKGLMQLLLTGIVRVNTQDN